MVEQRTENPRVVGSIPTLGTKQTQTGQLVTIEEDDQVQRLFLAPHGGGTVLSGPTHVVSPSSPLGRALLGKRVHDELELELPGRSWSLVIAAIE